MQSESLGNVLAQQKEELASAQAALVSLLGTQPVSVCHEEENGQSSHAAGLESERTLSARSEPPLTELQQSSGAPIGILSSAADSKHQSQ